ncbi:ABC transporter permease [Actinoplanes sp. NPDC026623]|uniref:ABC transporter permease n=1 Tax=Actinoplanes sp. NPDC026623 TaxID=3155610 RepID=UPI0033C5173A
MSWLALRLLRPYLITAAALTAAATAYLWYATSTVQDQLDGAGTPNCLDPNVCYPHGAAMDAVLGIELIAAFLPATLGLILGVALFAPEREDDTIAYILTQSVARRRWVLTKLCYAVGAGLTLSLIVAVPFRVVGTRYTVLANDTYEMLQLLHFNSISFMAGQTAALTALGGVLGLAHGRTLRTLALTVVTGPIVVYLGGGLGVLLGAPLVSLAGGFDTTTAPATDFSADISMFDTIGYLMAAGLGLAVLAMGYLATRIRTA